MEPNNGSGSRMVRSGASIDLDGLLPDWSAKSANPAAYATLLRAGVQFLSAPEDARGEAVQSYARHYCLPHFDLPKASGVYLLFRVVFNLPKRHPREQAKVFGGWLHPSVNDGSRYFDLSWPIHIDEADGVLSIALFPGYFGKGYDAAGEYDWMRTQFPFREAETLKGLTVRVER